MGSIDFRGVVVLAIFGLCMIPVAIWLVVKAIIWLCQHISFV
jgi:hypothetical protein